MLFAKIEYYKCISIKLNKTLGLAVALILLVSGFFVYKIFADPGTVITPATGGDTISIDTTSAVGGAGTYTHLTDIIITEGAPGEIATGDHVLTLPAGWEFDTNPGGVGITVSSSSDLALSSNTLTPTANTITFNVFAASSATPAIISLSGIWIRPTGTTLTSGNITHSGTAITGVVDGTTDFGAIASVAGAVNKIDFQIQPSNSVVKNIALSTEPAVVSQDQFGNTRIADTNTVTISSFTDITCSTPTVGILGGTLAVTEVAGVADFTSANISYDTIETIYLKADDGTFNQCSSAVDVIADPDIAAVAADKSALVDDTIRGANIDLANITVGLTSPLPASGANGSTITWLSNTPSVVSNDGQTVTRPDFISGNATVTLSATLTKGAVTDTKDFILTVLALPVSTDATVTSSTYTVSAIGSTSETITGVPSGTSLTAFLSALTKGQVNQTWDSSGLSDPVVTNNTLVVTAEDGTTVINYVITVDAAVLPTNTPTEAPTNSNNDNNNSQSAPVLNQAPSCHDQTPLSTPDLFKIITAKGSAKIIYTPVVDNVTGYVVMYGLKKGDDRFAAMISLVNNNQGEQNFTINQLNPKSTYYFKVAAVNGCTSGPWSDWIPAKADRKREVHKYKTVTVNKVKTLVNQFK